MAQRIPEKYDLTLRCDEHVNTSLTTKFRPHQLHDKIHHPVAQLQTQGAVNREIKSLQSCAAVYGMHAPISIARERLLVSQARRLPPFNSSMMSLDLLMGTEDTLDFDDFLNTELPDDQHMKKSVHALMEQRLAYSQLN